MRSTRAVRVVDACVVIEALTRGGPVCDQALAVMSAGDVMAPELLDVEVLHALRGLVRGGKFAPEEGRLAVRTIGEWPILRRPHLPLLPRIWELRDNLTACDAAYVALAEALRCPLVTSDARLASAAGIRCEVQVLGT